MFHLQTAVFIGLFLAGTTSSFSADRIRPDILAPALAAFSNDGPVFGPTRIHQVQITVSTSEWAVLQAETVVNRGARGGGPAATEDDIRREDGRFIHIGGGFGGYFPWVHADVSVDGTVLKNVGLRYKGNGSYIDAAGLHRNLKVKSGFFGGAADWDGLQTINFNAGGRDTSRLRETLTFALFRAAGVPASRTAYAEVAFTVPGAYKESYAGLYTVIENVNKQFLKRALPPGTGLLMKPERMAGGVGYYGESWTSYVQTYRPEREATPREQQRVIDFARLVNKAEIPEFRAKIGSFLDVDEFLRFIAINALVVSRDSYLGGRHNYFIYLDPKDDRFRFIPWDEDGSMAGGNARMASTDLMHPFTSENPLGKRLLDDPTLAAKYRAIVKEIMATAFDLPELLKLINSMETVVSEPLAKESSAMMTRGESITTRGESYNFVIRPALRSFIENRVAVIEQQISLWRDPADLK